MALMPAGAFAVHQLRYLLAFHSQSGVVLQRQGHAYLHALVPWIALGMALVAGAFLRALGRALGGRCSLPRYAASFTALWLACAGCLVAIYVSQECLEGLLATRHPAALVGIFGYGGWWAIPAALGVGLVLAAAFLGAHWVLHEFARRRGRRGGARRVPVAAACPASEMRVPRLAPIAAGWSGRGPPR